jgi:hypothetical protein
VDSYRLQKRRWLFFLALQLFFEFFLKLIFLFFQKKS